MPALGSPSRSGALGRLKRFLQPPAASAHCDLCGQAIARAHEHLLEPATRQLQCSCVSCAMLFDRHEVRHYRRVPHRLLAVTDFEFSDAAWDAMGIPINLAFFYRVATNAQVIACFPGPAGATESLVTDTAWGELTRKNPVLARMDDDVEALLVNRAAARRGAGMHEYFIVPADVCYRLIGLMKLHWTGYSGGEDVWREIDGFFEDVRRSARIVPAVADA